MSSSLDRPPSTKDHVRLLLLAAVLLLFGPTIGATPAESPDGDPRFAIDPCHLPNDSLETWKATVAIETQQRFPTSAHGSTSVGSGVVLARRPQEGRVLIATAAHVVGNAGRIVRVRWSREDGGPTSRAIVRWRDRPQDLALIEAEIPDRVEPSIAPIAFENIGSAHTRVPASVLAFGFPDPHELGAADLALEAGRVARSSSGRLIEQRQSFESAVRSYASRSRKGAIGTSEAYLHTAPIEPGSSGGPLVDGSGAVIAINVGSLESRRGGCVRAPDSAGTDATPACLHLAIGLDHLRDAITTWRSASGGDPRILPEKPKMPRRPKAP